MVVFHLSPYMLGLVCLITFPVDYSGPVILMPQCLVYSIEVVNGEVASFQTGKINMSDGFQDWSCSSSCSPPSHCHLPRCTKVSFRETFSGSKKASLTIAWVSNWGEIDTSRCVRGISSHKEPHSQKEHNELYKIPKFAVYRANVRSTRRLSGTCPDLEILIIIIIRIKVKKTTAKTDQITWKRLR